MSIPQERTSARQIFPFPEDGRRVEETPPCFSWLRGETDGAYTVRVWNEAGEEIFCRKTDRNFVVPDFLLPPGTYSWDIFAGDERRGLWRFTVAENAVRVPRVDAETLYAAVPSVRPRHLFFSADIPTLTARREDCETLRRTVCLAMQTGFPDSPDATELPFREYFGKFRDFCDRDAVALALAYALFGDLAAGERAKSLTLTFCSWNPAGAASLLPGNADEVGLSLARCLPSLYDLLYPLFSEAENQIVAAAVYAYGAQCFARLKALNYCENPGDSHAGRVPAYLGEAALVLKGTGVQTASEAIEWLTYAQDIYGGIFPYYGTPDGGWAEGAFYATSYTKWYLPFFSAVERFGGTRFLDRPFYQRVCGYFGHFANPFYENHPFGDGYWCHPEDAEWPGFFAQNPFRVYAARAGEEDVPTVRPDVFRLHLLDVFLPAGSPPAQKLGAPLSDIGVFPDAGFVCLHTDRKNRAADVCVMARASRFGSDSHRHADQGSFALFYGGEALISPSGYFGRRYGTKHHREWTNTTRAHNTLLVNGEGQATNSLLPRGKIVSVYEKNGNKIAVLDLSDAYASLTRWTRTLTLSADTLTVRDEGEAEESVCLTYPLHALAKPTWDGETITVRRQGATLCVTADPMFGAPDIRDTFAVGLNEGEPPAYAVEMPPQYHWFYEAPPCRTFDFTFTFRVLPKN